MAYRESTASEGSRPLVSSDFLDNPVELRQTLEERGALTFKAYASGLFPASDLPAEVGEATGMNMAWFRDNAHIANALYETGQTAPAILVGQAMLTVLHNNRDTLDSVVHGRVDPHDAANRLPVRVNGDTLANDTEQRVQNDSTGYALWLPSRLIANGHIEANQQNLDTLAQTVRYLDKIEYWQDPDQGHWEEDQRIHASSIGVAIAGLRAARQMFDNVGYEHFINFDHLLHKGDEMLYAILERGLTDLGSSDDLANYSTDHYEEMYPRATQPHLLTRSFFEQFSVDRRRTDAALLFLAEPLHVLDNVWAEDIVDDIEQRLVRNIGVIRYSGDTYWEPRFTDIMSIEERTTSAEGRIDMRNQTAAGVGYSGAEAQWTLFDSPLSAYWGRRYEHSGWSESRNKQLFYLDRTLAQLVSTKDGRLQLPETYYRTYDEKIGKSLWTPNDHMPLLWSQANLLLALKMFENTT